MSRTREKKELMSRTREEKDLIIRKHIKTPEGRAKLAKAMINPTKKRLENELGYKINWGSAGVRLNTIVSHPCINVRDLLRRRGSASLERAMVKATEQIAEYVISLKFDNPSINLELNIEPKDSPETLGIGFVITVTARQSLALPDLF